MGVTHLKPEELAARWGYSESTLCHKRMDLNETNIKTAKVGDVLKDQEVRGLELWVKGTKKVFMLYYRAKTGQQRRPKIGDYGQITISQARKVAKEWLGQVAAGKDPSKAFSDSRNEPTVKDLWDEFRKRRGLKKRTAGEDEKIWLGKLQALAGKRVSEVGYRDIADLHDRISKAAPISANRTLALLRTMFKMAVAPLRWIQVSPCDGVGMNPETQRTRYATDEEMEAIDRELQKHQNTAPASVAFIRLLILTGARCGEIARARWDHVHTDRIVLPPQLHKSGRKTGKDRVIHLPAEAQAILKTLPKTSGTITGLANPNNLWQDVRRDAGCPTLRLHDLRHSFASTMVTEADCDLAEVKELLSHSDIRMTQRYAHLKDKAAVAAANKVGEILAGKLRARTEPQLPQSTSIQ